MADVPKGSKMCRYCGKFYISRTASKFCSDSCRSESDSKRWKKTSSNTNGTYAYPRSRGSYKE